MTDARRALEWTTTIGVVVLALCALVLTVSTLRRAFLPPARKSMSPVDSVSGWRKYVSAGARSGPIDAPVTLVVFSDYQCPVCKRLYLSISTVLASYPDDVAVVWRHFPLENHPSARPAARAAVCAENMGRFDAMHSLLFFLQDSLAAVSWPRLALRAGLGDTASFSRCLRSRDTEARIEADGAAAHEVHAPGTPTLLVNELEFVGAPRDLIRIVRERLRQVAAAH